MASKAKRAVFYLRVSTDGQTTENQRRELQQVADARGWTVVGVYEDAGISGAKGRDQRPGLDRMLKDAARAKFDVVMCWAVDRLGRSLPDLLATLATLQGSKVDLFLHQQALDTTTPAGRAMFGMLGVFGEFERSMIQARVVAGLDRARAAGTKLGRPTVGGDVETAVRERLAAGVGILKIGRELGIGTSAVQRIKSAMTAA